MKLTFIGAVILIGGLFILLAVVAYVAQENENQKGFGNEQPSPPEQ
jgi:hypothetical protein